MTRRSITLVFVLSFVLTSPVAHAATESVGGRASIATGALYPDVSPDGKSLAVSYQGSIATLPAKGGTMRIVSKGQAWNVWPRWSPDGKRIAYVSAPNFGPGVVKLLNMETGKEIKLPKSVWSAGAFWFHPDGKRLFGRFAFRGMPQKLSFVDLGTGEITMVNGSLYGFGTRRAAYTLSPDGNWIYFGVQYDHPGQQGGNNGPQTDVHRIPSEGGKPEKLFQWPARIYHMCVAADGKSLFAMTDRGTAHNDIWQLPLDNPLANARKLSFGIADDDWPVTSPEGKHVYFTDNREGATAITAHTLASGESQDIRITAIDHRAPLKRMVLKLDAPDSNQGEAWRVSIRRKSGGFHFPPGAMYHITAGLGHFYHRGDLQMELPVGAYEIRVFRGPEFRADLTSINLTEGSGEQVFHPTVTRWTDMRAKGWYSGENHIHANYGYGQWYNTPRSILDMCEAEDLHVANLVVANSDGDAIFDREFFHGGPDPLSTANTLLWWNEEFRSTIWGHMTLFHLRHLVEPIMTGFRKTTNPWDVPANGEILRRTRRQGAAAGYTHPSNNAEDPYDQPYSAKGLPVDAALGLVDCADVMGNVYPKVIPFWYRLLNAGFRLPASAGTDCFLNRVSMGPPGWGRVYVKIDGEFTYAKWVDGLKRGRSFVSNGPMLKFTANGGAQLGDTISMAAPGSIKIQGSVTAAYPLERLEVVFNGKAIAGGKLAESSATGEISDSIKIMESGWLALRASGKPIRYWWGREQGAHTNPIYVKVKDHPQPVRESAEYFMNWIERLERDLEKRNRIPSQEEFDVQKHLDLAKQVYLSKILGRSQLVR